MYVHSVRCTVRNAIIIVLIRTSHILNNRAASTMTTMAHNERKMCTFCSLFGMFIISKYKSMGK